MSVNELIIIGWEEIVAKDLTDGMIKARFTQIESPKLDITSETDTITDSKSVTIADIYKGKKATLTGSASLFSAELGALQLGTKIEEATATNKRAVPTFDIKEVVGNKVTLDHTPVGTIKYVYKLVNKSMGDHYVLATGETPEPNTFTINGKEITLPDGTEGTVYIEYEYESQDATIITANADVFPEQVGFRATVMVAEPCRPDVHFVATLISKRAKVDATSVSWDMATGGKHAFTFNFNKDYCDEINKDLFSLIIAKD